ncbi:MAG: hypothetical protein AB8G05_01050 [Oligoflexales bacterium]
MHFYKKLFLILICLTSTKSYATGYLEQTWSRINALNIYLGETKNPLNVTYWLIVEPAIEFIDQSLFKGLRYGMFFLCICMTYRIVSNQVLPVVLRYPEDQHSKKPRSSSAILAKSRYFESPLQVKIDEIGLSKRTRSQFISYGILLKNAADASQPLPKLLINNLSSAEFQKVIISLAKIGGYQYQVLDAEALTADPEKAINTLRQVFSNAAKSSKCKTIISFVNLKELIEFPYSDTEGKLIELISFSKALLSLNSKNFTIIAQLNYNARQLVELSDFLTTSFEFDFLAKHKKYLSKLNVS